MPTKFDPAKLDENSGANALFAGFASSKTPAASKDESGETESPAISIPPESIAEEPDMNEQIIQTENEGSAQQLSPVDDEEMDKLVQINAKIPQSLYEAWEDKMYHVRKKYGVKLKKLDVIRDGVALFAHGTDYRCLNGHRFIVAEGGEELQQVHCPVCGEMLPNASLYRGVHSTKT